MARENLLATFEDYYLAKTGNQPTLEQKKAIATIISYNVFQMDGLKKIRNGTRFLVSDCGLCA